MSGTTDNNEVFGNDDTLSKSSVSMDDIFTSGLVIASKYVMIKEIGKGASATVWIVYNLEQLEFMAMKIQFSVCYDDGSREVVIVQKINEYMTKNPEKNVQCVKMHDFLEYKYSDNDVFVCSVYDLYACCLQLIIDNGKYKYGLPIQCVKSIIRQLLTTLASLHDDLNVIHTDIKPANILIKGMLEFHKNLKSCFEDFNFNEKYKILNETFERDSHEYNEELNELCIQVVDNVSDFQLSLEDNEEIEPDEDEDGDDTDYEDDEDEEYEDDDCYSADQIIFNVNRKQSVDDIDIDLYNTEKYNLDVENDFTVVKNNRENTSDTRQIIDVNYIEDVKIALTDFGRSYFHNSRCKDEVQDRLYRAPEVILALKYSYACDIWSVMCVAFELITGFALFDNFINDSDDGDVPNTDIQHLYLIEKMIGEIPLSMKKKSRRTKFLFDDKNDYHIKNIEPFTAVPLREILERQHLYPIDDVENFVRFLMRGFEINPSKRATASELISDPWLNC
jgi:serine/threonine protein kinase